MNDQFGGALQARRGELIDVLALPGFVAERDGRPVGVVTYRRESNECELAFIAALERHEGVGTPLLEALLGAVAECERICLVTTNDNLEALRFLSTARLRLIGASPWSGRRLTPTPETPDRKRRRVRHPGARRARATSTHRPAGRAIGPGRQALVVGLTGLPTEPPAVYRRGGHCNPTTQHDRNRLERLLSQFQQTATATHFVMNRAKYCVPWLALCAQPVGERWTLAQGCHPRSSGRH
jgi:hypothetical protein